MKSFNAALLLGLVFLAVTWLAIPSINDVIIPEQKISPDPPEIPERSVLLSFIGDIMAHEENYIMKDYNDIWTETSPVFLNDDFSFGNFETVVDRDKPKSTFPRFNIDPPYLEAAVNAGIDVFSLANNHSADQGNDSMLKTLEEFEKLKIEYAPERELYSSGINKNPENYLKPVYWEENGVRIGFLAATQRSNGAFNYGYLNFVSYIHQSSHEKKLIEVVREGAKEADVFILSFHGGKEYSLVPRDVKAAFFRKLIIAGADIIWAHHPHVLQPWKTYTINGSDKLIMYSLGNFISGQGRYINPYNPGDQCYKGESGIIQVSLTAGDKGISMDVISIPIVTYNHEDKGIIVKLFENITEDNVAAKWYNYYMTRESELKSMLTESTAIPY